MNPRNKYEISYDILKVCLDGSIKTHIVYKCNLNFKIVKKYLESLLKNEYIEEIKIDNKKLFKTTEKGLEILTSFDKFIIRNSKLISSI